MTSVLHFEAPPSPFRHLSPSADPDILEIEMWLRHPDGRIACVQTWGETEQDAFKRAQHTLAVEADDHPYRTRTLTNQAVVDARDAAARRWKRTEAP